MPKHFCFCLSLKFGAILMSFLTLLEGGVETVVSIIELSNLKEKQFIHKISHSINVSHTVLNKTVIDKNTLEEEPGLEGHTTLFVCCLFLGFLALFSGTVLLVGFLKAKEKYVLCYLLFGSTHLFIVLIYSGIYMFKYGSLLIFFALSVFMVYGQIAMYHLYEELSDYNTVKSGAIEITYNGDAKTYENGGLIVDDSIENTAV